VRAAGADGRVRFEERASGAHELAVVSGAFGALDHDAAGAAWHRLELAAGERAELELASAPVAVLTGRVRVAGRPLAGARVLVRRAAATGREGPVPALATESDAGGAFAFAELPPGEYALELDHPSRAQPWRGTAVLGVGGAEVAVELGEASISGRVSTPDGAPVAGARVCVLAEPGDDRERERRWRSPARTHGFAATGPQGGFELGGLEPLVPVRLEVTCAGFGTLHTGPMLPDELDPMLILAPAAALELELVSATRPFVLLRATGSAGEVRVVPVQAGRTTVVEDLAAGVWRLELEVHAERGAAEPLGTRLVDLAPGRATRLRWDVP
jgi:hypothetical protein